MKYVIAIILTALIVGLGVVAYFKGWLPTVSFNKPQAVSTAIPAESLPPQGQPSVVPSASPSAESTLIKAGGVLVFKAYSIEVPNTWTSAKETAPSGDIALDKLTLTKGGYKINIYQAATGGAPCLYPGEPVPEGPSSSYTSFVALTTASGDKLRRSGTEGTTGYTVCELQSGGYGQPTSFGHISITTPSNPPKTALDEIDAMLSSLKKI